MLFNGTRCHRKTVLGSQYCFAHLAKMGIKEIPIYKSNHKSRVIDSISKIVCAGNFYENQQVFPIYLIQPIIQLLQSGFQYLVILQ